MEKPSLNKTDSHKTRRKKRVCDSLSKTNRRFKRTQFAQEIRKDPKMKKKQKKTTISVTVTYLLNAKTSRSKLSSIAELTRVQAQCQRYMKSLFNTRLLCGETGRFTRRARIGESTHADFFCAVHLTFFWFILSCFFPVSFVLLSQQLYIRVFSPMMDI